MPRPDGTFVSYDGKLYIVTANGDVYVSKDQANEEWQLLNHNGRRAVAVRHQLRSGHTS